MAVAILLSLLLWYEIALLPSLCIVLFIPAFCSLYCSVALANKKWLQGLFAPFMILIMIFLPGMGTFLFQSVAPDAIWLLRGNMLFTTVCILIVELLSISWILNSLPSITGYANERMIGLPAFSPWDTQRVKQNQWRKNNFPALWLIDRGTKGIKYAGQSTWEMIRLWRAGNAFRPIIMLIFMFFIAFVGVAIHLGRAFLAGEDIWNQDLRWLSGVISGPLGVGLFLPAMIWWQRRNALENESLRPVTREQLTRQLYLSLAIDHWLIPVGIAGIMALWAYEATMGLNELLGVLLIFGIAAPIWCIGTNASVLAFKRTWVVVAVMIGLYLFAAFGVGLVVALWRDPDAATVSTLMLFGIAAIAIAAGVWLNAVMYRLAIKREWG